MTVNKKDKIKQDKKMIFGGQLPGDPPEGGNYFQIFSNWGDCFGALCYCPSDGYANSITVRLFADFGTPTAMVALLKPTAANIPTDAPYWEYGVMGPDFPIVITSADIIATSTLQTISDAGFANAAWHTFTFPFVHVSQGYYLLVVCGDTALGITGDSRIDVTNKGGLAVAGGAEHEFPSNMTFTPNNLLNFGMNFNIYCTYQKHVIGLNLTKFLCFKNK